MPVQLMGTIKILRPLAIDKKCQDTRQKRDVEDLRENKTSPLEKYEN